MASSKRRVYRRPRGLAISKSIVTVLVLAILALLRIWTDDRSDSPSPESLSEGIYTLQRVVDGDTLLLANRAKIRLIGADTPETVKRNHPVEPWGPEATAFTKEFLAAGEVRLQFDRERVDKYGRFLAYVLVDDRMLNEELIRAGLARAKTGFPYADSMKRRFRQAENEARNAGRGIWSDGAVGP